MATTEMATGKSRGAQSMLVLFLPNSKRAVSIISFYGHRRVSFHKPLVILRMVENAGMGTGYGYRVAGTGSG
jgi:hypothetical protein